MSENNMEVLDDLSETMDLLSDTIEKYDIASKTYRPLENLVLWFIGIGVGLYLVVFSNLDKIQINDFIPQKYILITSLILVGIGLVVTCTVRFYLLMRNYSVLTAKGIIEKIRFKFKRGNINEEDFEKLKGQTSKLLEIISIPKAIMRFLNSGMILIFTGLILFIGYYIYFLIHFK